MILDFLDKKKASIPNVYTLDELISGNLFYILSDKESSPFDIYTILQIITISFDELNQGEIKAVYLGFTPNIESHHFYKYFHIEYDKFLNSKNSSIIKLFIKYLSSSYYDYKEFDNKVFGVVESTRGIKRLFCIPKREEYKPVV